MRPSEVVPPCPSYPSSTPLLPFSLSLLFSSLLSLSLCLSLSLSLPLSLPPSLPPSLSLSLSLSVLPFLLCLSAKGLGKCTGPSESRAGPAHRAPVHHRSVAGRPAIRSAPAQRSPAPTSEPLAAEPAAPHAPPHQRVHVRARVRTHVYTLTLACSLARAHTRTRTHTHLGNAEVYGATEQLRAVLLPPDVCWLVPKFPIPSLPTLLAPLPSDDGSLSPPSPPPPPPLQSSLCLKPCPPAPSPVAPPSPRPLPSAARRARGKAPTQGNHPAGREGAATRDVFERESSPPPTPPLPFPPPQTMLWLLSQTGAAARAGAAGPQEASKGGPGEEAEPWGCGREWEAKAGRAAARTGRVRWGGLT